MIYLDNAATTPVDPRVKRAMDPYHSEHYGNPGALHTLGQHAQHAINNARETAASILHCQTREITFTSGATESINLALLGVAHALHEKGKHIITTRIEHHAVLDTCKALEREGYTVTYLNVDDNGLVNPQNLERAIRTDTILISIMYANNEIGTIQDIPSLSAVARKHNIIFHTDASQAPGYLDLNINTLGATMLSLNGSKIYGPKGTGCLYAHTGTPLRPLFHGGGQEHGLRSGTENVPGIVGFAKAMELCEHERHAETTRLTTIRDTMITAILDTIPGTSLNGHPAKRLPNNVNISFKHVDGESLVLLLNDHDICAGTGSACMTRTNTPSHVIMALGKSQAHADNSIRFSLGRHTTKKDMDHVLQLLPRLVEQLRTTHKLAR